MVMLIHYTAQAQKRTIGLLYADSTRVSSGYVLFAPKQNTMTYLIDNSGRIIKTWTASTNPPGQAVYLLENGHLLRACMTKGRLSSGGGEGGRVEEYDWNDSLVWAMDFSTDSTMQHHDIKMLPNGNVLMLAVEKKTYAQVLAAGFDPSKLQPDVAQRGLLLPDFIVEIHPTPPYGGSIVWEWHVWDHLIQNFDATKQNFGEPTQHPELIGTAGDHRTLPVFWNHMNSIDYHPQFDQIALSVRGNSEVWIIDHSTTSTQAKGHQGGRYGKGGDLLYRWGNPVTYGGGTREDQRYFEQHDVEWVSAAKPGQGHMTCFNNGLGRGNYSTVDEFVPDMDSSGIYTLQAKSMSPKEFVWSYKGTIENPLYSENISGAFRLSNGNTLVCSGTVGQFLEITPSGDIVWKYICPVQRSGVMTQGTNPDEDSVRPGETLNSVFRVYKYPPDYAAFKDKTLTPGEFIELYPSFVESRSPCDFEPAVSPHPFAEHIRLNCPSLRQTSVRLILYDSIGQECRRGDAATIEQQSFAMLKSGVYLLHVFDKFRSLSYPLVKL